MENYLNIEQASSYLKGGYHLYSLIDNKKYTFFYKENKVIIYSEKIINRISFYLFKEIYKNCNFYQEVEKEDEVDLNKDKEYYSWKQ